MGKIISVCNQKGGVGKTTTTINLAAAIAENNKKVLVVDIDPQGNTTGGFGVDKRTAERTVYDVLLGECTAGEAVIKEVADVKKAAESAAKTSDSPAKAAGSVKGSTPFTGRVDLIPANVNLAAAEIELIGVGDKEFILKNALRDISMRYDFLFLDCPPSLNVLTVNAMVASDAVLVPIQCEYYALEGLSQLIHTINLVRERLNPMLDVDGIVFTMFDARTNLSMEVVENVKNHVSQHIYQTIIPRSVRLAEAPSYGQPITVYEPRSTGAAAYRALAREVIRRK